MTDRNKNHEREKKIQRHSVLTNATVRDSLRKLNDLSGESMTLFAVEEDGRMMGSVTDGDVRRALINGVSLDDPVEKVMHRKFLYARPGENLSDVIATGRKRKVRLLPVLEDSRVVDIIDLNRLKAYVPVDAVLMAGGRGERLRPLTDTLPKPLLPVGGKAIIDYNVDELESCGIKNINVTVNYLADLIEQHFFGRKGMANVRCVREPKRLGTLGSLAFVDGIEAEDVLVMNSDLLMDIDFEAMYMQHRKSKAEITMAAVPYNVSVPFAIMRLMDDRVEGLVEKPTYNYFANGGVYIMKSSLIEEIPKGEYLDAPDFISQVIEKGGKVGCHHLEGSWIDIGSPDDYRMACELMSRRNR